MKAINNKIEQNKAQFNLNRQTAKIFALSGKDVLPETNLLEKAVTMKRSDLFTLRQIIKNTNWQKKQTKTTVWKTRKYPCVWKNN